MLQRQFGHRLADIVGLMRVQKIRPTSRDIAERTGAGADRSEDHHRRVFLRPALTDIRTGGLLTDGDEVQFAHQTACGAIFGRHRSFHTKPVGPTRLRSVRITAFFRVALSPLGGVHLRHVKLDSSFMFLWPDNMATRHLPPLEVDGATICIKNRLVHRLRQRRMRKNGLHELGLGRFKRPCDGITLNELGDLGADHMRAKQFTGF